MTMHLYCTVMEIWHLVSLLLLLLLLLCSVVHVCLAGEGFLRPFEPNVVKQYWIIVGDRIQNKFESNLVLDVYGKSAPLSIHKVGEYEFHGGENQLWTFEPVL